MRNLPKTTHPKQKSILRSFAIAFPVAIAMVGSEVVWAQNGMQRDILGDCGARSCEVMFDRVARGYPELTAQLTSDCDGDLSLQVFKSGRQWPRVSFVCWEAADSRGERTGSWLGTLPLLKGDRTFAPQWQCGEFDRVCQEWLPQLRSIAPETVRNGEVQCAMRNGELFFAVVETRVDLRCGFFATTVWDENGDGLVDYEDPVSVDISVGIIGND
ncbi:hypothetical protein IQ235_13900 [Oscillatoriales cyanobacterium LEGE 11467]|uniref:Uncharacterized protein n=1 Tax=Zarconia navalis LEGE 11467 TaxID=1828826 RepID=A0A928Z9N8_9CYAN|nr:hypothetical protein [Zarconia navalis]MBE9041873.1 hypothetical protein [Zarconia navalis LEGE 11467]